MMGLFDFGFGGGRPVVPPRSAYKIRFIRSGAAKLWRKVENSLKSERNPLKLRDEKLLAKFAVSTRQQQREEFRRLALESVDDRNPGMSRRERRALAKAYASGKWKETRRAVA